MSEVEVLRERLRRLAEASLRINASLEIDSVLQGVLDSARSLIGARYGWMLLHDDRGWIVDYVSSGMTPEQAREFWELPGAIAYHRHLEELNKPWRTQDLRSDIEAKGLPTFQWPFPTNPVTPLLAVQVRHGGRSLGAMYVGDYEGDDSREFTVDDEATLVMFASQAGLVISNARQHREEKQARADLETLVNTAPVGVMVIDAETGRATSGNREVWRIGAALGLPGDSVQDFLDAATFRRADGRQVPTPGPALADAVRSGETVLAEEIFVEAPDGSNVTILVSATPIPTQSGAAESMVVTVQDMTQFEELDRLRAEFLGIISHELRAPLAGIKGSATTLLDAKSSLDVAEVEQYHRIINEQADYMRDLIGDLIDVVRIETGTLSVNPATRDVSGLLDDARNVFLSAGGRDNLRINVAPDLPSVMADGKRIVQVLSNLLSNAERSSHEQSVIRVDATLEGVHVAISVADNGVGVPAERLPYLFQKFSRPDSAGRGRDLGLGLAICKGIVEAHGGRIWAASDGPGLGSRFTFTIPASEETEAARGARPSTRARRGDRSDKTRVLAVDDDPRTLKHVRDALTQAGFEPVVTGDPNHVATLIEEHDPQVVLLDLMLPGTDGIQLMRDILAAGDVPVIFLSAYDQDELIAKAFEMGAVDYMVKPFSHTELAARVRAALRKAVDQPAQFVLGALTINYTERAVTVAGLPVELTPTEYRLLTELSTHAGTALTHDQLLQRVWGPRHAGDARPLRTVVKNLRRKLREETRNPNYILTVPYVGYRMPKPPPPTEPEQHLTP